MSLIEGGSVIAVSGNNGGSHAIGYGPANVMGGPVGAYVKSFFDVYVAYR